MFHDMFVYGLRRAHRTETGTDLDHLSEFGDLVIMFHDTIIRSCGRTPPFDHSTKTQILGNQHRSVPSLLCIIADEPFQQHACRVPTGFPTVSPPLSRRIRFGEGSGGILSRIFGKGPVRGSRRRSKGFWACDRAGFQRDCQACGTSRMCKVAAKLPLHDHELGSHQA